MDITAFILSFFETTQINILEAIMLICWGLSWPVSVIKALRTKIVHGKSPLFMSLIAVGYLCGILNKFLYSRDYLVLLYILNLSMILTDLYLYSRYNSRLIQKPPKTQTKTIAQKLEVAKSIIADGIKQTRYPRSAYKAGATIPPYFLKNEEVASLHDGTFIYIRSIHSEDEPALRRFFETLSQESVFFSFGQLRINMLHDHLAKLCRVDFDKDLAFVAVVIGGASKDIIIGEVRLNKLTDLKSAELSFIVNDQWQGKGIGNLLMAFCLKLAKEIGLQTPLMLVMRNNVRMKRFGYKYDFQKLPCKKEDDMEEWQLKINQTADVSHAIRKIQPIKCKADTYRVEHLAWNRDYLQVHSSSYPAKVPLIVDEIAINSRAESIDLKNNRRSQHVY